MVLQHYQDGDTAWVHVRLCIDTCLVLMRLRLLRCASPCCFAPAAAPQQRPSSHRLHCPPLGRTTTSCCCLPRLLSNLQIQVNHKHVVPSPSETPCLQDYQRMLLPAVPASSRANTSQTLTM